MNKGTAKTKSSPFWTTSSLNFCNYSFTVNKESDSWPSLDSVRENAYKAILEENLKAEKKLVPFYYIAEESNSALSSSFPCKVDSINGISISNELAIVTYCIAKVLKGEDIQDFNLKTDELSENINVEDELINLFSLLYPDKTICPKQIQNGSSADSIFNQDAINKLSACDQFAPALKKVVEKGKSPNSYEGNIKTYALSALSKATDKLLDKEPDDIKKTLEDRWNESQSKKVESNQIINLSTTQPQQKKSIWPKVLGITACALIAGAALAFTLFTCGIGTGILLGLGGVGKAILGFTAAYVGESIGLGVGIFGAGVCAGIHLGSELHDTIKHNKSINNNGYTLLSSQERQVHQNNNNNNMVSLLDERIPDAQNKSEELKKTNQQKQEKRVTFDLPTETQQKH